MDETIIPLRFRLNGQECRAEVNGSDLLIDFIRDRLESHRHQALLRHGDLRRLHRPT